MQLPWSITSEWEDETLDLCPSDSIFGISATVLNCLFEWQGPNLLEAFESKEGSVVLHLFLLSSARSAL